MLNHVLRNSDRFLVFENVFQESYLDIVVLILLWQVICLLFWCRETHHRVFNHLDAVELVCEKVRDVISVFYSISPFKLLRVFSLSL